MSTSIHGAKPRVLFLCTGNACRSQMAEGWARTLHGDRIEPYSAGIQKHGLDRWAVQVMQEAGVDISRQKSKTILELGLAEFDLVVTVCEDADRSCPALPVGGRRMHVGFPDPPQLARGAASEAEALEHYRRVRDEIRAFVERLPQEVG